MVFGGFFSGGGGSSNNNDNDASSSSASEENKYTPTTNPMFSKPLSTHKTSSEIREHVQEAITINNNVVNAKYLIQKINETCFDHCVTDPSSSLSNKETTCLNTCMEKYIEAWNTVSKTYVGRLQKEGANLGRMTTQGAAIGPNGSGKELF